MMSGWGWLWASCAIDGRLKDCSWFSSSLLSLWSPSLPLPLTSTLSFLSLFAPSPRWVLKIADFGLGDLLDEAPLPHLLYQAPELLRSATMVMATSLKEAFNHIFISGTWASHFKQWWVFIFHNQNCYVQLYSCFWHHHHHHHQAWWKSTRGWKSKRRCLQLCDHSLRNSRQVAKAIIIIG